MLVIAAGATRTARIERITAAGADPEARVHTPTVDAEVVRYGRPVSSPAVPTSPRGTPTPALVTRAVVNLLPVEPVVADAGLAAETAAPTVSLDASPGEDVRTPEPVPDAARIVRRARAVGRQLPTDRLVIGETIPAGTTTALGVLTALGERETVSSSLPDNPIDRKREVVSEGLTASGIDRGECAGRPVAAVRQMGDPVLAAVFGVADGALAAGREVTLGGGTQLATVAALLAHDGRTELPTLATTAFLAADESADLRALAADLGVELRVTDPEFGVRPDHPATAGYLAGEAKEGVGMGGALALAEDAGVSAGAVREAVIETYDRLTTEDST